MKKIYLLLAAFASLSIISTVSISNAIYGRVIEVIPGQVCQGTFGQFSDSLFYGAAGLVTQPEFGGNTFVSCPIPRSALGRWRSDIAVNLRPNTFGSDREMTCVLYEIAKDPIFVQILRRNVQLPGIQSTPAYFENVRPQARDSSFVVECFGSPDVILQNIEIRLSRGR